MTKQEKLIVSAYTEFLMINHNEFLEFVEKKLNRPVYTHEMASQLFWDELREAVKEDFLKICEDIELNDSSKEIHNNV